MTIAFQLAVFALIATSSILLISVPVVFASPDGWSSNKNIVFSGTSLWIGLVFLVGILNSLISWTYLFQIQKWPLPLIRILYGLWDTVKLKQYNNNPPPKQKIQTKKQITKTQKLEGGVKLKFLEWIE